MPKFDRKLKRKEYQQALDTSLNSIIDQVREIPEIIKVISFGSYNSGTRDLFTDLNLVVIMETEKDFIKRTADLYGILKFEVDLDLLVYTPIEFNNMKEGMFLRRALEGAKVLYEN